MTTNKPEVVAVMYQDGGVLTKQECGIAFDTCCKVETPLIRLSDYEALQAEYRMLESELATVKRVAYRNVDLLDECEELRIALAESRANDQQAMYYLNQVREIVGGADFPDMVERCRELVK